MTEKQDLRVIRTHKLIRNALIELLKNQAFDNIAVQDIVDTAMVNRATFYKYYSGKSDLAGAMIADFKTEYAQFLTARHQTDDLNSFFETVTQILYEQRHLILTLWKIKTKRHHLYDDMFLMIKQNYIAKQQAVYPTQNFDYQGEMLAHIVLKTAQYYFEQDLPIPIKQVWGEIGQMLQAVQAG